VLGGKPPSSRSHASLAAVVNFTKGVAMQAVASGHEMTMAALQTYGDAAALATKWWGEGSAMTQSLAQKRDHFGRRMKQGLAALPPSGRLVALKVPQSSIAAITRR
jgi:hypothetical protein